MIYNLQDIINRFNEGKHLEYVFFWGHHAKPGQVTKACFSQWYPCSFEVDGITYNCAEQYMMAGKARVFNDEETLGKILSVADKPQDEKATGGKGKSYDNFMKGTDVSSLTVVGTTWIWDLSNQGEGKWANGSWKPKKKIRPVR